MTRRFPDGMSVATKTLAVRIWAFAQPRGWDMTVADVADELGETSHRVRRVVQLCGWSGRFRSSTLDTYVATGAVILMADAALDEMGMR